MESGQPVKRVLFVVPDLEYSGAAKQVELLAGGLPRYRNQAQVVALVGDGPVADRLRSAAVTVEALGWRRWIDVKPFWRLRQRVRQFGPDIIHAWRLASMRAVLAISWGHAQVVVSAARAARQPPSFASHLDRRLLSLAGLVVASSAVEMDYYRRLGLPENKLAFAAPGVLPNHSLSTAELHRLVGLPVDARLIVCVGPLEPGKGFRDALWAFDILKFLYDNLHLVLIGEGSDRKRLEQFARNIRGAAAVHFAGPRLDVPALLAQAEIVWVPSRAGGGVNSALEAMAAGRPVVAARVPDLAEIVADGETGFLVPRGDKVALARQTRRLLDDLIRGRAMGEAGRRRALSHFSAENLVDRVVSLYERVGGES